MNEVCYYLEYILIMIIGLNVPRFWLAMDLKYSASHEEAAEHDKIENMNHGQSIIGDSISKRFDGIAYSNDSSDDQCRIKHLQKCESQRHNSLALCENHCTYCKGQNWYKKCKDVHQHLDQFYILFLSRYMLIEFR